MMNCPSLDHMRCRLSLQLTRPRSVQAFSRTAKVLKFTRLRGQQVFKFNNNINSRNIGLCEPRKLFPQLPVS